MFLRKFNFLKHILAAFEIAGNFQKSLQGLFVFKSLIK